MKNLLVYKNGATRWSDKYISEDFKYFYECEISGFNNPYYSEGQSVDLTKDVNYIKRMFIRYNLDHNVAVWLEQ